MVPGAWNVRAAVVSVCVLASPAGALPSEEVAIVTDINLGEDGSYPSYLLVFGEFLYFRANNISGGNDTELWRYDGVTAEMVADLRDPIPGGTGNFTSVGYPWIDAGRILFTGEGADGQQGIYLYRAGIHSVIVDRSTPIPEGSGTFTDFRFNASQPSISGDYVAFRGLGAGEQQGLYLATPESVRKIFDRSDTLDGKTIRSLAMGPQSLVGTTLCFQVCFTDGTCAIYPSGDVFRRGDANADGFTDISDPIRILLHLFAGAPEPPCSKSADADDTGRLEITDAVHLLAFLFVDGPSPPEPFDACGVDTTIDVLTCESYPPCQDP